MTSPISSAAEAVTGSASSAIAVARACPISRGSVQEAPLSRASPTLAKASRNFALSAAIRKSATKASDAPAPAAIPFTAAMTGLGMVASASTIGLKCLCTVSSGAVSPAASRSACSRRSCPAQKPRPAPVSTTARTAGSAATSRTVSSSASFSSTVSELSASGRFSVTVATPSLAWSRTVSDTGPPGTAAAGERGRAGLPGPPYGVDGRPGFLPCPRSGTMIGASLSADGRSITS